MGLVEDGACFVDDTYGRGREHRKMRDALVKHLAFRFGHLEKRRFALTITVSKTHI